MILIWNELKIEKLGKLTPQVPLETTFWNLSWIITTSLLELKAWILRPGPAPNWKVQKQVQQRPVIYSYAILVQICMQKL